MNFYTKEHLFYCGVDLHTRSMYICVLDQSGQILLRRNLPAKPHRFLNAILLRLQCPAGRVSPAQQEFLLMRRRESDFAVVSGHRC